MNCIVPFSKDVKFSSALSDIVSISLEHEISLNDEVLLGNFVISGTYKTHELSANALDFEYTLPFELSLGSEIDEASLCFEIDNFTYSVLEGDTLRVNIDYLVKADEKLREITQLFDLPEEVKKITEKSELNEVRAEETSEVRSNDESVFDIGANAQKEEILKFASNNKETFISYKVHTVKEGETLETICKLYNKSESLIKEYNQGVTYIYGDKVLVPEDDE